MAGAPTLQNAEKSLGVYRVVRRNAEKGGSLYQDVCSCAEKSLGVRRVGRRCAEENGLLYQNLEIAPRKAALCTSVSGGMPRSAVKCTRLGGDVPRNAGLCTVPGEQEARNAALCTKRGTTRPWPLVQGAGFLGAQGEGVVHGSAFFGRRPGQKPSDGARGGFSSHLGLGLGTEDGFSRHAGRGLGTAPRISRRAGRGCGTAPRISRQRKRFPTAPPLASNMCGRSFVSSLRQQRNASSELIVKPKNARAYKPSANCKALCKPIVSRCQAPVMHPKPRASLGEKPVGFQSKRPAPAGVGQSTGKDSHVHL